MNLRTFKTPTEVKMVHVLMYNTALSDYQPPPPTPGVVGILCGMTVLCGRPAATGSLGGSFLEMENI